MIKKCIGCGITLQWEDENELGYIKKDKICKEKDKNRLNIISKKCIKNALINRIIIERNYSIYDCYKKKDYYYFNCNLFFILMLFHFPLHSLSHFFYIIFYIF